MPLAFLGPIGFPELLVLLGIVVLLFGAKRIPELARGLGEGIRGFKGALRGDEDETTGAPGRDGGTTPKGNER